MALGPASAPSSRREFPWWLADRALPGRRHRDRHRVQRPLRARFSATVAKGIGITIFVTVVAFALASALGLGIALMGLSGSAWLRQIARFYVEIIRGVPILVLLFWIAFVGAPALVAGWNCADRAAAGRRAGCDHCRCATSRCCGARSSR